MRLITRRNFLRLVGAGLGGAVGTGLYAWQIEPHWLEITRRGLPVAGLPESLVGKTLVQMSDLHIGPQVSDAYLRDCCRMVKALEPDFVVYTGDFMSYSEDYERRLAEIFPELPLGSIGTFGILGNHDYGPDWAHPEVAARVAGMAEASGVRVLRNEVAEAGGLHVAGLDDLWARRFQPEGVWAGLPEGAAAIVLSHNPDTVDLPGWGDYAGWILAGHTHGGQCKAPFLPPPLLPVRNLRYTSGAFELEGGRRMYISRGVGHTLQIRFNVRPEAAVFELERA